MAAQYHTTPAGYRRLLSKLEKARTAYRAVVATNEEANEAGDSSVWHDNFAYEENQRQMHQLACRVRDLEQVLGAMTIVDPPAAPDRVVLGCAVTVIDGDGEERRYVIGGFEDGEPTVGRVSYTSPLAKALLGAETGDVRELVVGGRRQEIEVLSVGPTDEGEV